MIEDLIECSEQEMLWEWAKAEIKSSRFGQYYGNLAPDIQLKVHSGDRGKLNATDFETITAFASKIRSPLLKGLSRLQTRWYAGRVRISEILDLRAMNWPPLVSISPSRQLPQLVNKLESGESPANDDPFLQNYQNLRDNFDETRISGRPILVAEQLTGPYTIIEGYSRLSVLASRLMHDQVITMSHISVIVGICPRLSEWYLNDDSRNTHLGLMLPR